jgi:ribosomal-protein-alanine N-acetyltransferase
MSFRIEPLRYSDIPRCVELERLLYQDDDPWSELAFQSELDFGNTYLGAFVDGERLVGYAGMSIAEDASVHNIGVDPAWQRKGIGRALLVALLDLADERGLPVFLEVRTDNIPAITLYESHGFTRIGLRRKYYQPSGADAYTMVRGARIADEEPV